MSTAHLPQRKPRQALLPTSAYSDIPSRLVNVDPASPTPSTSSTAAFFTLPAAIPVAPKATLTASSPLVAVWAPTPTPEEVEVPEQVATVPEMEVNGIDAAEVSTPVVTSTTVASGTESSAAEPQTTAVTTLPGSIAMGSIAGVALLLSLIFLLYKWRRGTLTQTLNSAARTLKIRPKPTPNPEADSMEKGLSDASSIRSQSASIHSVSSFMSTFSSIKRSISRTSGDGGRKISRPVAGQGQGQGQGHKLAVPLQLHLARLEAAGLWTADTEGPAGVGMLDPRPMVEGPDVHPLRAHRVRRQGDEQEAAWPL